MPLSQLQRLRSPAVRIAAVSILIFVFLFLYRFNTLGGALGGFDDDHFVPFTYAKQVEGGEQPLRDFTGLGLQGAWPSLTYEVSAAAQSLLGDNLRSEALLTVSGVAAAAALTVVVASFVAPLPIAVGVTLLTAFLGTKLYSFPKVLVLSGAALLLFLYSRSPSRAIVAAFAVLTAVAFLFRHDLAVFVTIGAATVFIAAAGSFRRATRHLFGYAILTALLLVPSLVFVQRYAGLGAYIADSRLAIAQEANRTGRIEHGFVFQSEDGQPLTPRSFLSEEQNAVEWLYILHLAVPAAVLLTLWRPRPRPGAQTRAALLACAVMTLAVAPAFLRGNAGARFGDMAPLTSVLVAALCALAFQSRGRTTWRLARIATAIVLLIAGAQSVWTVGGVRQELENSGWSISPSAVANQAVRRSDELRELPRAYWSSEPESPSAGAIRYLHGCTRPSDRVLLISYQPELLPLADRRFAAGRAALVPGLLTDEDHQRQIVERWRGESVPLVLVEPSTDAVSEIAIVFQHLVENYVRSGQIAVNGGLMLDVYADRLRTPPHTFGPAKLPCFD